MKKLILVAAAALMTTGAFAQNFDWGIKVGGNLGKIANMDLGPDMSSDMAVGFYAGAFAEFPITDFLSIQPELVYSMQGFWITNFDPSLMGDIDTHGKLHYINIPVLAKIYPFKRLSVEIGPQFGYLLSAKQKSEFSSRGETTTEKSDLENTKNFDVSVAMGLSYKFGKKMDISARYNLGLTEISKNEDGKNGVFQLGVGYRF